MRVAVCWRSKVLWPLWQHKFSAGYVGKLDSSRESAAIRFTQLEPTRRGCVTQPDSLHALRHGPTRWDKILWSLRCVVGRVRDCLDSASTSGESVRRMQYHVPFGNKILRALWTHALAGLCWIRFLQLALANARATDTPSGPTRVSSPTPGSPDGSPAGVGRLERAPQIKLEWYLLSRIDLPRDSRDTATA